MVQVTLRKALLDDAETVHSLVRELGYPELDDQTFGVGFEAVLANPTQQALVAEVDGQVVGFMSLNIKPQVRLAGLLATIDELVVTESARGRGVGKALVEFAKAVAVRVGAGRLELHTARKRASYERGFYTKNGFAEIDSAVLRWEGTAPPRS
jgi:GNAT superfamily N-acetyltransferase